MIAKAKIMTWIKRIGVGLGLFLLTTSVLASIVLFTPVGTSLVRWVANNHVDGLQIQKANGSILLDPEFEAVSFTGFGIELNAEKIQLELSPSALFHKEIQIDTLALRHAQIDYTPNEPTQTSEPQTQASTSSGKIVLPVKVSLNNIVLDNISLQALGNKVVWQGFSSALAVQDSQFTLKPTQWDALSIYLAKTENTQQQDAPQAAPKPKQAIVLPKVELPIDIEIQGFELSQFAVYQQASEQPQMQIDSLKLQMRGANSDIDITQLDIDMPQALIASQASVTLDKNYPLTLGVDIGVKLQAFAQHQVKLQAQGDLKNLHADIDLIGAQQAKIEGVLNVLDPKLPFSLHMASKQLGYPIQSLSDYRIENSILDIEGSLDSYQLALQGKTLGLQAPHTDIKLQGSGGVKESGDWLVDLTQLDISGDYKSLPLDIEGKLEAKSVDKKIRLNSQGLHIAHGKNKIILTGGIGDKYDLNLQLAIPQLAKSIAQAKGSIKGNIGITGALTAPKLAVDVEAKRLAYQHQASLESMVIKGIVDASIPQDSTQLPSINADLNINARKAHILDAGVEFDELELGLQGSEKAHQLTVNIKGEPVGLQLNASGGLDVKNGWSGRLASGKVLTAAGDWQLEKSTDIDFLLKNKALNIDAHCWSLDASHICLAENLAFVPQQAGGARLALDSFSLDILNAFVPETTRLNGSVDATVNAKWSAKLEPNLDAEVDVSKGSFVQEVDKRALKVEWESIGLKTQIKDRNLDSSLFIDMTDNGDIKTNLSISNLTSKHKKMQGTFAITPLDIAFLSPVLGDNVSLKGDISSQITISGSVDKPALSGDLQLNNYQLSGDAAPIYIDKGQVHIGLDKYSGTLDGKLHTDGGNLLLSGDADWRDLKAWLTHFNIKGNELRVTPKSGMSIVLSPDLTLSASPTDAEIAGKIVIPWARIKVRDVPKGAVSISEDQQFLDSNLQVVKEDKAPPLNIKTDVSIEIDKNVKLQAFGLNSFLQGTLHITQVEKKPNIVGDINLIHGTYQAFGQDLEITKGAIMFNGPPSQPYVDVAAIRNPETVEDDVTAGIKVTGPASKLSVTIFSDPNMEQANALSYILSGRALGSTGGDGGMTSALLGLGLAQSGEFLGGIGNALGVQDLSLDAEGEGDDTAVAVSGYLTPDLQLKYGVGLFSPIGEFTLKYRLMKRFYVQAVTGMDNAADLLYQFSFD